VTKGDSVEGQKLLEASAKLAGLINHRFCGDKGGMAAYTPQNGYYGPTWNPLTNDADAHRLGAMLHVNVTHVNFRTTEWSIEVGWTACTPVVERVSGDPAGALRRAYVRFAADVWNQVESSSRKPGENEFLRASDLDR
jgi:hypothetical protein